MYNYRYAHLSSSFPQFYTYYYIYCFYCYLNLHILFSVRFLHDAIMSYFYEFLSRVKNNLIFLDTI
jgi:hypothetical protein